LRGPNDTPFVWPTPGQPIGCPGVGHPQGIFGVFSYYQLVTSFVNMVYLTVAAPTREYLGRAEIRSCILEMVCNMNDECHGQADHVNK
jgi:hypothetical protein